MRELFIYYRVAEAHAAPARAAAVALQAGLQQAHPQLLARVLRRPDAVNGQHTWMETYAMPSSNAGIDAALQAAIEDAAAALLPFLASPRHTEVFIPCAW